MFKKVMLGVGIISVLILIIITLTFRVSTGMTSVINQQLLALKSNNLEKAYSFSSKEFQSITSMSDFEKFIDQYPALKNSDSASFTERSMEGNLGIVKGILHAKNGADTPIEYNLVKENNQWKILGITVNPSSSILDKPNQTPIAFAGPVTLTQLYDNQDSRYKIKYPTDWIYDKSAPGTIVFSGKEGTPQYYSTVNIQTILTKKTGGQFSTVKEFIADLKKQASKQSAKLKFYDSGSVSLTESDKTKAEGEYIVFSYDYQGQEFKQWQVVVIRSDEQVFYAWAYTSPMQQYQMDYNIAKAMYDNWSIY